jgi:hypothetical protein
MAFLRYFTKSASTMLHERTFDIASPARSGGAQRERGNLAVRSDRNR